MPDDPMSVFISYSHDSAQHEARVLALADRLRADGIDAMVDQYQTAPPDGWQLWMEKQIRDAKFVLLVCPETYLRRVMREDAGKGLGVMWESSIIYSYLYNAGSVNTKFIPIVFDRADTNYIPIPLQPTTYYFVGDDPGYESLYRRLTNQPAIPVAPLGKSRYLPSLDRATNQVPTIQPNLVHPYALQSNFTGRIHERAELTAWLTDDARPIFSLVAMGGMGKSTLAWYWLKQDVLPSPVTGIGQIGVMWWSFYEGEASFAKFVDEALKYVSGHDIDAARLPTTYDRALELRRELQSKRVLFVLDGFERQLRAYARLDAAYLRDDATESWREAQACVEPDAARLLKDIATGTTRAKVLLTSRLMVSDLEDRAGNPLAGVLDRELKELGREDAIAFMRAQGVTKGTPAEIATVCEAYGNHPLSLRLLSGLIARDTRTPGDIAAAPRHDVHADLVQRQHHILDVAYNSLPIREKNLIRQVALIPNALTWGSLKTQFGKDFRNEAELAQVLSVLQERGLYTRDPNTDMYNMHVVLRRYLYDLATDREKSQLHVQEYFSETPIKPKTSRSLRVFLCHAHEDKVAVRDLYRRLGAEGIEPWLDEEDLLPGMDWQQEIPKAVQASDIVLVCLSRTSTTKVGYVQKEIKFALDVADEQPEGAIFLIPLRLEKCDVPERVRKWQYVDLFDENGYSKLMRSLWRSAEIKGLRVSK